MTMWTENVIILYSSQAILTSPIVTFARTLRSQLSMVSKWSYEIWLVPSLLFVFCPPMCAGRFNMSADFLFYPTLIPFMYEFMMLLSSSFLDYCALIKSVIVSAATDCFSVVIPTELIFLFLLCVSVIHLSMSCFLSFLCCISFISQLGSFSHNLLVNILFGSIMSTPSINLSFTPPLPRPLTWTLSLTLPRPPKRHTTRPHSRTLHWFIV